MTRRSILIFAIAALSAILLCACGSAQGDETIPNIEENGSAAGNAQSPWYEAFDLKTDRITIYYEQGESFSAMEVTDTVEIKKIADAVDWRVWENVSLENQYSAEPCFYIDFHNGTIISLLSDVAYGSVGNALTIETDNSGTVTKVKLAEAQGPFIQNDEFLQAIQRFATHK